MDYLVSSKKNQMEFNQNEVEQIYQNELFIVQDSLSTLLNYLPPKERVAFVLSEVFDSKNDEIAEIMGNTEGAVKSALVRAREKLKVIQVSSFQIKNKIQDLEKNKILNFAVDAFNRRDLDSFAQLFASNAIGNAPGCFYETSAEEIKKGSLFYTINNHEGIPQSSNVRAELIQLNGETMFALFDENVLDDIWMFTVENSEILRFDSYYCCPDVLEEIALNLKLTTNNHGYWFEQKLKQ